MHRDRRGTSHHHHGRPLRENGRHGVEFHTRPKSWGPNILQFGMSIEDAERQIKDFARGRKGA